jgi:hypothetical protein
MKLLVKQRLERFHSRGNARGRRFKDLMMKEAQAYRMSALDSRLLRPAPGILSDDRRPALRAVLLGVATRRIHHCSLATPAMPIPTMSTC